MHRTTWVLLVAAALATSVLAYPAEWETSHRLEPRRWTSTTSTTKSKTPIKLTKKQKIIVGSIIAGIAGLIVSILACAMCKTCLNVRKLRRIEARKNRIEHSNAKPEDLEAVNKYPELFETPAHERLDGWNAHTINAPPPPFASARDTQDDKDLNGGGMDKQPAYEEKSTPVDRDAWKQGTAVSPSIPEPTYAEPYSRPDDKDSGEKRKSRFKIF